MFDDPLAPIRRRIPTGPPWTQPEAEPDVLAVPFAVRYGVPPELVEAKHSRPPTRTTTSIPTQVGGDGAGNPPRPDDTIVVASD